MTFHVSVYLYMNEKTHYSQESEYASSQTLFFFFNDTATTEIYTLSLHDALPILDAAQPRAARHAAVRRQRTAGRGGDRKSTRLNSSHGYISYAVFCLKKKRPAFGMSPGCKVTSAALCLPM